MMREAIENFADQLIYEPVLENSDALVRKERLLVCGMGGSQWPVDLLSCWNESALFLQHRDYGLPTMPESELRNSLIVASSFSGNTEETVSGLEEAITRKLPAVVIASGGTVLEIAKSNALPYIQVPVPGENFQPRAATGLMIKALLTIQGDRQRLEEMTRLGAALQPKTYEAEGERLATECKGRVPIIYASRRNAGIAMAWKIKLNETGKIPAFFNIVPEQNHNELNGFDVAPSIEQLTSPFKWVFLIDEEDHPRNTKRFDVIESMCQQRGLPVVRVPLNGVSRFERIITSTLKADWFSLFTAEQYDLEPTEVPMVEEFKKLIQE